MAGLSIWIVWIRGWEEGPWGAPWTGGDPGFRRQWSVQRCQDWTAGDWALVKGWGRGARLAPCLGYGGIKGPGVEELRMYM